MRSSCVLPLLFTSGWSHVCARCSVSRDLRSGTLHAYRGVLRSTLIVAVLVSSVAMPALVPCAICFGNTSVAQTMPNSPYYVRLDWLGTSCPVRWSEILPSPFLKMLTRRVAQMLPADPASIQLDDVYEELARPRGDGRKWLTFIDSVTGEHVPTNVVPDFHPPSLVFQLMDNYHIPGPTILRIDMRPTYPILEVYMYILPSGYAWLTDEVVSTIPASCDEAQIGLPPTAPTSLSASQGEYVDAIKLDWLGSSSATHYEVYRERGESDVFIGTVDSSSCRITGISSSQRRWYKIRACNGLGCSEPSAAVSGYAQSASAAPATPAPESPRPLPPYRALSSQVLVICIAGAVVGWLLVPAFVCVLLARRKGRRPYLWLLSAIVFGWISVLLLALCYRTAPAPGEQHPRTPVAPRPSVVRPPRFVASTDAADSGTYRDGKAEEVLRKIRNLRGRSRSLRRESWPYLGMGIMFSAMTIGCLAFLLLDPYAPEPGSQAEGVFILVLLAVFAMAGIGFIQFGRYRVLAQRKLREMQDLVADARLRAEMLRRDEAGGLRGLSEEKSQRTRSTAAVLAFFLGGIGAHRFYLGKTGTAFLMLLLGISSFFTPALLPTLITTSPELGWFVFAPGVLLGMWVFVDFIVILSGGMRDREGLHLR